MDYLNYKMQGHVRVCEEDKLEEKMTPIETVLSLRCKFEGS